MKFSKMRRIIHYWRLKRAITLTEMLIVVAIISVLIALLLPTVGRAKTAAKDVACLNNLRQIHLYMNLYAGDNDGFMPSSSETGIGIVPPWYIVLQAYTTNAQTVFMCPAWRKGGDVPSPQFHDSGGYGANEFLIPRCDTFNGSQDDLPLKIDYIPVPSEGIMFHDNYSPLGGKPTSWAGDPVAWDQTVRTRHSGNGFQAVFFDGHTERFTLASPSYVWDTDVLITPYQRPWLLRTLTGPF